MKPIGGYPELELSCREEYHSRAIRLNTARNALEYILRVRGYKRVYLPLYTCEALYEPFERLKVEKIFYGIDLCLEPVELPVLGPDEAIVYTDYFGIKSHTVRRLAAIYGNRLIVDNAQAFYARPLEGIDTIYSPRKFFGVSDGGYLYTASRFDIVFPQDESYSRIRAQLKRADLSAEAGYDDFRRAELDLCGQEIRYMSELTRKILSSIDYCKVGENRIANYTILHESLKMINGFDATLPGGSVPMAYPLYAEDDRLRDRLIKEKIFIPLYWPNVFDETTADMPEYKLAKYMFALPVSQIYEESDMKRIIRTIL